MPTELCGGAGSQEVVRVRPAEFIRTNPIVIWPHKGRALHRLDVQGQNVPCPRATQLSLSKILPGAGAQQCEAVWSWVGGASGSSVTGRCQSGLGEGGSSGPPRATQLRLSWIFPDSARWVGPPKVKKVRPPGAQRLGLEELL